MAPVITLYGRSATSASQVPNQHSADKWLTIGSGWEWIGNRQRLVPRKRLARLLGRPHRRRMRGDHHVSDASPIVGEDQDEQGTHVAVGTTKSAASSCPM
jgi:hypothetical protein